MTPTQWQAFDSFRTDFRAMCASWADAFSAVLPPLQRAASEADTPPYPLETPVVYNRALDDFTPESEIHLIVIGDNPGKDEQLARNNRYLVGQSGKIAANWFQKEPVLETDFRKNVIILNKTPVHTAKTAHLKAVARNGGEAVRSLILESQLWMAEKTAALHQALVAGAGDGLVGADGSVGAARSVGATAGTGGEASVGSVGTPAFIPELWLVGYAELKARGIFLDYRDALKTAYLGQAAGASPAGGMPRAAGGADGSRGKPVTETGASPAWERVFVYQHFSMNRFLIDLKTFRAAHPALSLPEALHELGRAHRAEIFG